MLVITGATGYLGAHLCGHLLQRGENLLCLRRESSSMNSFERILSLYALSETDQKRINWVNGDIMDPLRMLEVINEGDRVYHCAAEVTFAHSSNKLMELINVKGTANIVNACLENKAYKLCHVSSIGALGKAADGELIHEETYRTHLSKTKGYGYSKYLGELEVYRGIAEGLNAVIVNPSVIIGPGDTHQGIGKVKQFVKRGLQYYPSGSSAWVDVRDVASAMIFLMNSECKGERFIISSENLHYREFLSYVAEAVHKKKPDKLAPVFLLRLGQMASFIASLFKGHVSTLPGDLVNILCSHAAYDSSKYRKLSGKELIDVRTSVFDSCNF
jgi:nucleoside-diphosphate-sugar epimerase